MKILNIGKDFSIDPSGRYYSDGNASGEQFREEVLWPKLKDLKGSEKLKVVLDDGVEGYGSSFLVESFGGIVKFGYMKANQLLESLVFEYQDSDFEFYEKRIESYINQAIYKSDNYK